MPSTTKTLLKYLFHVQYYDGNGFIQNEEDISVTDPAKSAYYDVEQDKVEYFELIDPTKTDWVARVDLTTGEFTLNATHAVSWEEFNVGDPGPKPYKLIFYRQHTHNFNLGLDELSHEIRYCIGYADANNVEHKVYID